MKIRLKGGFLKKAFLPSACGFLLVAGGAFFGWESVIKAKLHPPVKAVAHISIDGRSYGNIIGVSELGDLEIARQDAMQPFNKVTLKREIVTEPSLYFWARSTSEEGQNLKDIEIDVKTPEGKVISQYTLKNSKPLHWTLEVSEIGASGGFHERIELAVQEIAIR